MLESESERDRKLIESVAMWRRGGRGLSQLLQRALPPPPPPLQARFTAVASSRWSAVASAWIDRQNVPWWQQRMGISVTGDGSDSHDDFKPVQKDSSSLPSVQEHIEKDVKENPVLVYMKGVPEAPQCGFSAMVVRILDEYGVQYKTRNVLTDPELRTAIKEYSKWPTIPQVYVKGEFVGGSDIVISMHRSGELEKLLKDVKRS